MGCLESKGVHIMDGAYLLESHFPTSTALRDREPLICRSGPTILHDSHVQPTHEDLKHHPCVGALWGAERASVSTSRMRFAFWNCISLHRKGT